MEMTSKFDPPDSSITTSLAAIRTHPQNDHSQFSRSISHKEPSFSEASSCTPPRLSSTSLTNPRLYVSQPSTPRLHSFTSPSKQDDLHTIYRCISSVLKKDGAILSVAASNGLVYTGSQSNVIRIWKLPEFTECGQLKSKACMVVALEVSNDKVYAAYADCKIRVWHRTWEGTIKHVRLATIPRTGGYVRSYITGKDKLMKHAGPITSLAINVSDDILYSASVDKTVKVWRISNLKCIETIHAHQEPINAIVVADDGVLFTASDDASIKVWRRNFCSGDRPHSLTVTLPAKYSPVKALTLASDGGVLYGGCSDGYVHYWLKGWFSGQLQYGGALQGHTHTVMCLANVGNYVVSGSADSSCRVWVRDPQDGQHRCLAALQGHRGPIRCIAAFLGRNSSANHEEVEDGCTICTGSLDGVLKVWRVKCTSSNARGTMQSNCEYFDLA
ncbi:OLC1v1014830C1 [Oldenlandia corymbosa var. corymbosa]|uniref:OLC1v1014830C1 n=1 Tax=Oldenlandia corymbosa var. corymbosa TaxID=529605 RepID=A0AAV1E2K0_OLDCO|nr:OLC1v1014830C1 [Oldenlandia corymbosa var. corymbosa]